MTPRQALDILRQHNIWRRWSPDDPLAPPGPDDPQMVNPKALGEAIDAACSVIVEHEAAMSTLRMIADGDNRTRRKKLASACVLFLDAVRGEQ